MHRFCWAHEATASQSQSLMEVIRKAVGNSWVAAPTLQQVNEMFALAKPIFDGIANDGKRRTAQRVVAIDW